MPFNLSHMPELKLVSHPTHLGASPGSVMDSGCALEHSGGGSVDPQPALILPTLSSTNVHKTVASVIQCVFSITPFSGVNHLPTPCPTRSHTTQAACDSGACSLLSRV